MPGPLQRSPRPRVASPSVPALTLLSSSPKPPAPGSAQTFPPRIRATAPPGRPSSLPGLRVPASPRPAEPRQPAEGRRRGAGGGRPAGLTAGGAALTFPRIDGGAARAAWSQGGADAPAPRPSPGAAIKGGAQLWPRPQRLTPRRAHHGPPGPATAAAAVSAAPRLCRAPHAPQVSPRSRGAHSPLGPPTGPASAPPLLGPDPLRRRHPLLRAPRHSDGTFTSELSRLRESARLQRLLQGLVGKRR